MFSRVLLFFVLIFVSVSSLAQTRLTSEAGKIISQLKRDDFSVVYYADKQPFLRFVSTYRTRAFNNLNATFVVDYGNKIQVNKTSEFDGQCVSFVKAVTARYDSTRSWLPGRKIQPGSSIKSGTAIATFSAPGNKYDSFGNYGGDHVGILLRVMDDFIYILDQNWIENDIFGTSGTVGIHKIYFTGKGGTTDAYSYYEVM